MNIRKYPEWLLWVAALMVLSQIYHQIFVLEPVNSDTANALLVAQDMSTGNWRLHGWFMAPDNYIGLDEISYVLIWRLTGNAIRTLRLVPTLQWTALMFLAAYLGTRHKVSFQSLAISAAILFIPVFGPITEHLYFQAPFHIPTTICMLLAVMLCDRLLKAERIKWLWASLLAFIIIVASFSDPFFQFILTIPLLFALWMSKAAIYQRVAFIYLLCVACGMLLLCVNATTGGFTHPITNVPRFTSFYNIPAQTYNTLLAWIGILGCFPFSQPLLYEILAMLRLPLILLLLLPLLGCARRVRTLEFTDLCLLLIVGADLSAVIVTGAISNFSDERFLLPAWVCAAILAAKFARKESL